ncbi:hypothetical protein DY000_02044699 [Brassica cretica]|uniref:Uncharacterized protein n=1 Tax=Brassica cretica TaxID=69181 RepID=A0ABQ7EV82_BRACR|nr:hypothetical protein DY000_02044699 [Brassica cretica]
MMETFPKTTVDVFALVLESGGSKSHDSVLSKPLNTTQNAICVLLPEYDNLGRLLTTAILSPTQGDQTKGAPTPTSHSALNRSASSTRIQSDADWRQDL